jgi:hypothetical protein
VKCRVPDIHKFDHGCQSDLYYAIAVDSEGTKVCIPLDMIEVLGSGRVVRVYDSCGRLIAEIVEDSNGKGRVTVVLDESGDEFLARLERIAPLLTSGASSPIHRSRGEEGEGGE